MFETLLKLAEILLFEANYSSLKTNESDDAAGCNARPWSSFITGTEVKAVAVAGRVVAVAVVVSFLRFFLPSFHSACPLPSLHFLR